MFRTQCIFLFSTFSDALNDMTSATQASCQVACAQNHCPKEDGSADSSFGQCVCAQATCQAGYQILSFSFLRESGALGIVEPANYLKCKARYVYVKLQHLMRGFVISHFSYCPLVLACVQTLMITIQTGSPPV